MTQPTSPLPDSIATPEGDNEVAPGGQPLQPTTDAPADLQTPTGYDPNSQTERYKRDHD